MDWKLNALGCLVAVTVVGLAYADPVNVNTADADTLAEAIDGVGSERAAAIVEYRSENGGFGSIEELMEVPGIGVVTVEENRHRLSVGE